MKSSAEAEPNIDQTQTPPGENTLAPSPYSGARGTAVKILNRIERSDAYLDKLLDIELKSDELVPPDKGLLSELVHGVVRWQGRLDWLLGRFTHGNFPKSEVNIKNALRVALYQILFLERLPQYAAVNEAVEFVKRIRGEKAANMVNAVLRTIIRNHDAIHYPNPADDLLQYLSVFYSHPQWIVRRWLNRFSKEEAEKLLAANNEIPPITLRINKLKITPAAFLAILDEQRIPYSGSSFVDYFIKTKSLSGISQLDVFRQGYFSIQDESAALPALLMAPQPGERIIDMCAAPGGKTTLLAELMNNQGEIIAIDRYEHRLNMIHQSCDRLAITNVRMVVGDAAEMTIPPAAKVLLDAPCSGLGVLRKKPDIKWKREPEDIPRLTRIQETLLESGARAVQPGGVLVYSTCTTEPEENEMMIRAFLLRHPEFSLDDPLKYVNRSVVSPDGFVVTFPHIHHLDGSFAARLIKSPSITG